LDLHLTENGVLRHLCGEKMRIRDVPSYKKQINLACIQRTSAGRKCVLRNLCGEEIMSIRDIPSYQKQINWHAFEELVRQENGLLRHLCGERMSIRDIPSYHKQINWHAFEELARGQHVSVNTCVNTHKYGERQV
jgi:ribosome-binding factor A